jgi:hypothetical protein
MAQVPVFFEGALTDVSFGPNAIAVMGVEIRVPDGTPICSATVCGLTVSDLKEGPLPGRAHEGFLNGTAIVSATRNIATGVITADDVFVEPAENVLIGVVTANSCSTTNCDGVGDSLSVLGLPVSGLADPRIAAGPIMNDFGFELDLRDHNAVGTTAATEGYFGSDAIFHYTGLSLGSAPLLNPTTREVSIIRAQCRQRRGRAELKVRGATHTPNSGTVTVVGFGSAAVIPNADDPNFGLYNFARLAVGDCPTNITVNFGPAAVTSGVDVLID